MAQDISFYLSEPFTPNANIVPTSTQDVSISFLNNTCVEVKTAQEIYITPDSCDFYTPECSSYNSEVFIISPSKQFRKVTFLPITHSPVAKTNKIARVPIKSMFPAKYRRIKARNIPPHQLPNTIKVPNIASMEICKSPDSNRRDSLRPRICVLPNQKSHKSLQSSPVISKKLSTQSLRSTRNKVYKCQYCPNTFNHPTRYGSHLLRHYEYGIISL